MLVLGIESFRGETGVALHDAHSGLRAYALYSQIVVYHEYGGVMPKLASRDHIRRVIPLLEEMLDEAGVTCAGIDTIAYTKDPELAGALLVGTSVVDVLAFALGKPLVAVYHLEGHLLSPSLEVDRPEFPFPALLVSGGHTQLMRVDVVGQYTLLGETFDGAVGGVFDKAAKLLGLDYPGGPTVSRLAEFGNPGVFDLPRPMLHPGNFDFSLAGLETAVLTQVRKLNLTDSKTCYQLRADLARAFVDTVVKVLVKKTLRVAHGYGLKRVIMADGIGANHQLREDLNAEGKKRGLHVHCPGLQFYTDNGAMITFVGAMRLQANPAQVQNDYGYGITPRWDLENIRIRHA